MNTRGPQRAPSRVRVATFERVLETNAASDDRCRAEGVDTFFLARQRLCPCPLGGKDDAEKKVCFGGCQARKRSVRSCPCGMRRVVHEVARLGYRFKAQAPKEDGLGQGGPGFSRNPGISRVIGPHAQRPSRSGIASGNMSSVNLRAWVRPIACLSIFSSPSCRDDCSVCRFAIWFAIRSFTRTCCPEIGSLLYSQGRPLVGIGSPAGSIRQRGRFDDLSGIAPPGNHD